jgi:hypothetical protein
MEVFVIVFVSALIGFLIGYMVGQVKGANDAHRARNRIEGKPFYK